MIRKLIPKSVWNKAALPYHFFTAIVGNIIYGFPGRRVKAIGITGTNGKSTSALLLTRILQEAGYSVGLSSTVLFRVGEREWLNETNKTVLGRFGLLKLLKEMADVGADYVVLEVTSHALKQYRVLGVNFELAVLTNMSPEHLDYHGDFTNYRKAKGKLFAKAKRAVLNADDPEFDYFDSFDNEQKWYYGLHRRELKNAYWAKEVALTPAGTEFVVSDGLEYRVTTKLLGEFNVYNALSAFASAVAIGVDPAVAIRALGKIGGVPGRMEAYKADNTPTVVVDYAHSPDAFEALFNTLKKTSPKSRIIAVFGATGDRDRSKRPAMGRIASELADVVILTNEEPYTEDPDRIIKEIESGIPEERKKNDFYIVRDRREALLKALSLAKPSDVVTLTGMGHQKYAVYGTKKIPWDDRELVKEVLGIHD